MFHLTVANTNFVISMELYFFWIPQKILDTKQVLYLSLTILKILSGFRFVAKINVSNDNNFISKVRYITLETL